MLAFSSGDGHDPWAWGLFWLIAAGDYLDGFLARATGQYSRMGALLDPVVDRLTILSGGAVCWYFELLPRWALAVLAVREVVTLILGQIALRRGQELEINWYGRIAVFPIMGAIFWAMVFESVGLGRDADRGRRAGRAGDHRLRPHRHAGRCRNPPEPSTSR